MNIPPCELESKEYTRLRQQLNGKNKPTWKCRLFGCRDEYLPVIFHDSGEKHGISGWSFATATTILITYTFKGCHWCHSYKKLQEDEPSEIWPKWLCDCEICQANSLYWKNQKDK